MLSNCPHTSFDCPFPLCRASQKALFGRAEKSRRSSSHLNHVFCDGHHSRRGQRQPGPGSASAPMAGYPKRFNIEMDPREDLNVFGLFPFAAEPAMKEVEEYRLSNIQIRPRQTSLNSKVNSRSMSAIGPKQTSLVAPHMSAFGSLGAGWSSRLEIAGTLFLWP